MFVRRIIDHILNQVLVEGLANSRWFQRFAVWSHNAMKELQAKSKDHSGTLDTHVSSFMEIAKQKSAQLRQEFQEELRKVQQQQQQMKR
ncbi:hypothetical protein VOLCADRAFT_119189 [Volvox carteri f. nagariensis]|uniref:Uncharacterized protein n=1 Tax=Volvox carteri f. nagariensis TaxID=3068 RepID=D8UAX1_VOLCA|nr:uncharacterized protein VOLCADRAFT_119189 [Volvox carteri f. nagariensis]EFJ43007.1 hypothetical protein VOLCADRAFT_119189 [Volvox carteri f. nagariensis]|eukprot:XP_002955806.1 hypothetical protein VOLCADRAFT_119189 [Volvox carteri f. nagariensis]